jgi:PhnO protein
MNIRKANFQDLNQIHAFMCELEACTLDFGVFQDLFQTNLQNHFISYFVAEEGENLVGFISLHKQYLLHHCGLVGEIQEFFVSENSRGKGIGKLLMSAVKKDAIESKIHEIEVTTNKKRIENVSVYEGLGFELSHNKFTMKNFTS